MLEIGKIVNTHGLKGELRLTPWCDGIDSLKTIKNVIIDNKSYELKSIKEHKNVFIIKLSGIDDINDTNMLINKVVTVSRNQLPPLSQDTYYVKDLIGLKVYNGEDFIGEISDVFSTPANDVYVIKRNEAKDVLVPAIKQVVKKVSISEGKVLVDLTKEYFDEN